MSQFVDRGSNANDSPSTNNEPHMEMNEDNGGIEDVVSPSNLIVQIVDRI